MNRRAVAELIKRAREGKGLTQDQLADAVGVKSQQVYRWETRRALPDRRTLPRLAEALELGVDRLYDLVLAAKDETIADVQRDAADSRKERDAALAEMRQIVVDNRDINEQIGKDVAELKALVMTLAERVERDFPGHR